MDHELLFQNPVFNDGLNVTVRNGDKWMKANIGDTLILKETGKPEEIKRAKLIGKGLFPAILVPQDLLSSEHDPACRNVFGLVEEMKRIYEGFQDSNLVTVLLFKV